MCCVAGVVCLIPSCVFLLLLLLYPGVSILFSLNLPTARYAMDFKLIPKIHR